MCAQDVSDSNRLSEDAHPRLRRPMRARAAHGRAVHANARHAAER